MIETFNLSFGSFCVVENIISYILKVVFKHKIHIGY